MGFKMDHGLVSTYFRWGFLFEYRWRSGSLVDESFPPCAFHLYSFVRDNIFRIAQVISVDNKFSEDPFSFPQDRIIEEGIGTIALVLFTLLTRGAIQLGTVWRKKERKKINVSNYYDNN